MSCVLRSPEQHWTAAEIWSYVQAPAALPKRLAFQGDNSPAYVLQLLRAWHQGVLTLLLDPKLPSLDVQTLLAQEQIEHCISDFSSLSVPEVALPPVFPEPQNLAAMEQAVSLIRTSGSSGSPKLAQHSWGNHVWSAQGSQAFLPLGPESAWLLSLPMFHVGGLAIVVRCWLAGAQLQVPAPEQSLAEALVFFEPTHVSLVPTQLQRLLAMPDMVARLQRCQAILLGGAPVSPALLQAAQAAQLPVHTSYGSTEMSSQITTTPPGFWQREAVTEGVVASGALLPHRQLRLQAGEIQVRGETLFQGYRHQGKLHRPLLEDWWPTGDLGVWQAGQLYVTGRKDNLFISGGENIQPEEIEASLLRHPAIAQAMVVPVPDPEFGERPVAFVGPGDVFEDPDFVQGLRVFLAQYLPRFKIPLAFYAWPSHLQGSRLKPGRRDFTAYAQQRWQAQTGMDTPGSDMLR